MMVSIVRIWRLAGTNGSGLTRGSPAEANPVPKDPVLAFCRLSKRCVCTHCCFSVRVTRSTMPFCCSWASSIHLEKHGHVFAPSPNRMSNHDSRWLVRGHGGHWRPFAFKPATQCPSYANPGCTAASAPASARRAAPSAPAHGCTYRPPQQKPSPAARAQHFARPRKAHQGPP